MPAIDASLLVKAMDKNNVTRRRLADELGVSIQYVCDITAGRRTLKRNPELRKRIAEVCDVPTHWIEHQEQVA